MTACTAEDESRAIVCPTEMARIISTLTDAELAALEDDLDFCRFAGVPSHRILSIMDLLDLLDHDWRKLLDSRTSPRLPPVQWSGQTRSLKSA